MFWLRRVVEGRLNSGNTTPYSVLFGKARDTCDEVPKRFGIGVQHDWRAKRVTPALKRISKYEREPRGLKALAPPTKLGGFHPGKTP
jgi:hypothetical protein